MKICQLKILETVLRNVLPKSGLIFTLRCFNIPLFDWVWMINQENVNFLYMTAHFIDFVLQTVGNKAKGRISKRVSQENKARQIFRKTKISYLLIRTLVCISRGKKCSFFGKVVTSCLSLCNTIDFSTTDSAMHLAESL